MQRASEKLGVPEGALRVVGCTMSVMADPSKSATYGDLIGNKSFSTDIEWQGKYRNSLALKSSRKPRRTTP